MAACRLEDQLAERHDEAGRLGDRDELVGRDDATFRVVPTRQRFEPGDVERAEVHDRLVHHLDLARAERDPQFCLERQALLDDDLHRRLELQQPPAALVLGGVQGDVGVAQQVGRVGAVADEVGTDRTPQHDRPSGDLDRK